MTRRAFFLCLLLLSILTGSGCSDTALPRVEEMTAEGFHPIPDIDLNAIQPATPLDYAELRSVYVFSTPETTVVAQAGTKCQNASDPQACVQEFDALSASNGFSSSAGLGYRFEYLAVNADDRNFVIASVDELIQFLGSIDSEEKAAFLADATSYRWASQGDAAGGIRSAKDGYELIVTKMTQGCPELETRRMAISISSEGEIREGSSEIIERSSGCVY